MLTAIVLSPFVHLFLVALALFLLHGLSSAVLSGGYFAVMPGLLTAVTSLVAEHRL